MESPGRSTCLRSILYGLVTCGSIWTAYCSLDSAATLCLSNGTYKMYRENCSTPPDVGQANVLHAVRRFMRASNASSVWLPVRRVHLGGWYWLDGRLYNDHTSSPSGRRPGLDCAVLRVPMDTIDVGVDCTARILYHICEVLDNYRNDSKDDILLLNLYENKYVIRNKGMTWYEAKDDCARSGYRLATFPNGANISHDVRERSGIENDFWIGLRQKDFRYQSGNPGDVTSFKWDKSALEPQKDCVVLLMQSYSDFIMKLENCELTHSYVCLYHATGNNTVTGNETFASELKNYTAVWKIAVPVAIGITGIILVSAGLFHCWHMRRHTTLRGVNGESELKDVRCNISPAERLKKAKSEMKPLLKKWMTIRKSVIEEMIKLLPQLALDPKRTTDGASTTPLPASDIQKILRNFKELELLKLLEGDANCMNDIKHQLYEMRKLVMETKAERDNGEDAALAQLMQGENESLEQLLFYLQVENNSENLSEDNSELSEERITEVGNFYEMVDASARSTYMDGTGNLDAINKILSGVNNFSCDGIVSEETCQRSVFLIQEELRYLALLDNVLGNDA